VTDWISEIRQKQTELAKQISTALFYQLPTTSIADVFHAILPLQCWSRLPSLPELGNMDWPAVNALLMTRICHDVDLAVMGYVDWMASALIRSGNLKSQTLPVLPGITLGEITFKYYITSAMVRRVAEYLERPGTELPPLGYMEADRRLVTDEDALRKFASYYRWG